MMKRTIRMTLAASATALAIGLAPATIAAAAGVNPEAAAQVPAEIKERGVLRVGTNLPYPPMEFFADDGKTPTGVDVDLASEIATRIGLKVEFVNMNWDGLIPALNSGRFEMIAASVGDFPERQKQADFVDYMTTGVSVVVANTDTADYRTNLDLCGKRLSAAKGTDASRIASELAKECTAKGTAGTTVNPFPDDNAGLLALRSKRVDAHAMDSISAAYEASTEQGKSHYRNVLPDFAPTKALYGMVVAKRNKPLTDAVALVLSDMIADGAYKAILDKYGVGGEALTAITVNAGGKQDAQ